MVGGGAASMYDPLYTVQFTARELRAAVDAATDYGTYVATHVYNVTGIRRAIEAGVKSIEHGHLADEDTVALMAERDVWLSMQRSPRTTTTTRIRIAPRRTGRSAAGSNRSTAGRANTGCGSPSVPICSSNPSPPRGRARWRHAWPTTSATWRR